MFWPHPVHVQAVSAWPRHGLGAAEGREWGRETLNRSTVWLINR